jgi:hypothetical protein
MKISDWSHAAFRYKDREELLLLLSSAERGHTHDISVSGRMVDKGMVAVIVPVLVTELRRRIEVIEAELVSLGVEIDNPTGP